MRSTPPLRFAVRLTPRGGRDAVEGWMRDGAGRPLLKARVKPPPVEGAANLALIALVAKSLGRPSAVRIAGGEHARIKLVEIEGVDEDDLHRAFGAP